MKLYNRSKILDAAIRPVLVAAKQLAKCPVKDVVVRVGKGETGGGCAHNWGWVSLPWLQGKRRSQGERMIKSNGCIEINFNLRHWVDPLAAAESFLETAIHEFHHVKEYNEGGHAFSRRSLNSGRRPAWRKRPEEIRAVNATNDAMKRLNLDKQRRSRVDELLLNLAVAIEGVKS